MGYSYQGVMATLDINRKEIFHDISTTNTQTEIELLTLCANGNRLKVSTRNRYGE